MGVGAALLVAPARLYSTRPASLFLYYNKIPTALLSSSCFWGLEWICCYTGDEGCAVVRVMGVVVCCGFIVAEG